MSIVTALRQKMRNPVRKQQRSHRQAGQGLEAAVAIGVVLVGRPAGKMEAEKHDRGGGYVRSAFKPVGNKGSRVGREAHQNLG